MDFVFAAPSRLCTWLSGCLCVCVRARARSRGARHQTFIMILPMRLLVRHLATPSNQFHCLSFAVRSFWTTYPRPPTRTHTMQMCGGVHCGPCIVDKMRVPVEGVDKEIKVCQSCFSRDWRNGTTHSTAGSATAPSSSPMIPGQDPVDPGACFRLKKFVCVR